MLRGSQLGISILLFPVAALFSQPSGPWRDPSSHTVKFVTVEKSVRLEVLDWGGSGRPVVLLAGGGNTAHVFDDFAPKLRARCRCHVYGITQRGFGASGYSPCENGCDCLGDDVLAVIRFLKLNRQVLVGHSVAGCELSSVATRYPTLVAGLIYLEAAYPYAFDNGKGPTMTEFEETKGPQPPTPRPTDLASFRALQKWDEQVYGFRMPEAEFRQTWDSTGEGRPVKPRDFPGSQTLMTIMMGGKRYADIPVPALAIFAIPHVQEPWMSKSTDPAVREAAKAYFTRIDALAEKQARTFADGVTTARVIRLPGMHYLYLSNESDVLRETCTFLAGLK